MDAGIPVWVDQVEFPDLGDIRDLPFNTFGYLSSGTDSDPDRNWSTTRATLLDTAETNDWQLSDDERRGGLCGIPR